MKNIRIFTFARGRETANFANLGCIAAINPDFTRIVYGEGKDLWLLDTANSQKRILASMKNKFKINDRLYFSPDGKKVLVNQGGTLWLLSFTY